VGVRGEYCGVERDGWGHQANCRPTPRENDVLVDVRAIGVNPGEATIRSMCSAEPGGRSLLGWEFAGVVSAVGAAVARFKVGDRVFGTGDMTRDGCWAETLLPVRWCLDLG
jgi:NADPH2:quinone reductase